MVRSRGGTLRFGMNNSSVLTIAPVNRGGIYLLVVTHSLGFFLGPGRALTFTGSSTPAPSSLFVPVFGLDGSFFTDSSAGGGTAFETAGAGVSFASDLVSSR